jgi:hypothetical protein
MQSSAQFDVINKWLIDWCDITNGVICTFVYISTRSEQATFTVYSSLFSYNYSITRLYRCASTQFRNTKHFKAHPFRYSNAVPLYLITAYRAKEVQLQSLLTSAMDGSDWLSWRPGRFFFSYGSTALYGPGPPRFVEASRSHTFETHHSR